MLLSDQLVADAAVAKQLETDLIQTTTALNAALADATAKSTTILALNGRIYDLQQALADCQGNPPPSGYLFGVNRSPADFPAFVSALAPQTIDIERVYVTNFAPPFPNVEAARAAGHRIAFSFKPGTYADIIAGRWDNYIRSTGLALGSIEGDGDVQHEPENDPGLGTPAQSIAAWEHAVAILRPLTPKMSWGKILMGWTFNPASGRKASDWFPPSASWVGNDGYTWPTGGYIDPGPLFARTANFADAMGVGWGIYECNAPASEPRKAEWIGGAAQIARDRGARCMIAFEFHQNIDWRSANDPKAMAAWRAAAA